MRSDIKAVKIKITKPNTRQPWFTMRLIIFNPKKHFISTDEAKEFWRKEMRRSKKTLKDEYGSIYASAIIIGRGKSKHYEFDKSVKTAANTIIIVPNRYKKEAMKMVHNIETKW